MTLQELCQAYLNALSTIEGEFSGDLDASKLKLKQKKEELEETFGVTLEHPWGPLG
jgi:hypothetical protein